MVCEKDPRLFILTNSQSQRVVFVPEKRLRDGLLRRLRGSSHLSDGGFDTAVLIVASDKRRLEHYPSRLGIEAMGIEDQLKKVKIPGLSALALSAF